MSDLLNPRECKAGQRWLVSDWPSHRSPYEVLIVEWSDSGKHVRVQYQSGIKTWLSSLPYKVEKLQQCLTTLTG